MIGGNRNPHEVARKKWENQLVLNVGDTLQRPREPWEGAHGPPVPSI
jgi:hypothetical protein